MSQSISLYRFRPPVDIVSYYLYYNMLNTFQEVRILAHMSRDEALLSLFQKDKVDIYKQMSSLIRNKPVEEVTADERSIFKQVTLAILYGMSPNQVGKKLSISKTMAEQMMNDFFLRFRGVKEWIDQTKEFARRNHFVLTISGRRRYLDGINSNDNSIRRQAERQVRTIQLPKVFPMKEFVHFHACFYFRVHLRRLLTL